MEAKVEVCSNHPVSNNNKSTRIPRPPNAFMLFANSNRKKLAMQYPHDSNKDISCRLGQQWKILEPQVKEHYFEMAKTIDLEHKRKYPDYVYNPKEARLRKAMRESTNSRKSVGGSQKNGNKKSDNSATQADPQNLNKPYQFLQNASSYLQIVPPNSWMQMNNVQQPHIWIQYHPANVTVPKALVLVPPRVVNFPQQRNAPSTFSKTQFFDPQIVSEPAQSSANPQPENQAEDVGKVHQVPYAVLNVNETPDKCQNPLPEKAGPNFFVKPNQVVYSNPANFDYNPFHCQGVRSYPSCSFGDDFDMYTMVSADQCSKYVCLNGQYMQTNVNMIPTGNSDSQILKSHDGNAGERDENVKALDLSKVASVSLSESANDGNCDEKIVFEEEEDEKIVLIS